MEAFAEPFPHWILDGFAPPELVRAAEIEWPDERWPHWLAYDDGKLATKDALRCPPACQQILARMLSLDVEALTGIAGTFGDWTLHGAGMHMMPRGSVLGLHLDGDHHPLLGWRRRLNAILFVTEHWESSWHGELELWSADRSQLVRSIEPRFNRLVLFETGDANWHGVPSPLQCSRQTMRRTLSVFFWERPVGQPATRPRAEFAT